MVCKTEEEPERTMGIRGYRRQKDFIFRNKDSANTDSVRNVNRDNQD